MDRPDLVPDRDALSCRYAMMGMICSKSWFKVLCEVALDRRLTDDEWAEVWSKATSFGPIRYEDTWEGAMERIKAYPPLNPWRSQV